MFKNFDLNMMKSEMKSPYRVIYLNYNKVSGIKILNSLNDITEDDLVHFNNIYIFNDDVMHSVYFFDKDNIKYSTVEKNEFENHTLKEYYLEKCSYKKIKVRVGETKNGSKKIQYVEVLGGEK